VGLCRSEAPRPGSEHAALDIWGGVATAQVICDHFVQRESGADMSPQETEEIVRRFLQVWSVGNLEILEELAHSDLVVRYSHFPAPVEGPAAFRGVLEETFSYFPDLKTTAKTVLVQGDQAAVEWHYEGTLTNGVLSGVEANGQWVRVSGITLYRIQDEKVVEERGVVDLLGLMAQLNGVG
jgi:steroid delta-isomerase-like uncharacterized protein